MISQSELQYAREVFKQTKMVGKNFNSLMRVTYLHFGKLKWKKYRTVPEKTYVYNNSISV